MAAHNILSDKVSSKDNWLCRDSIIFIAILLLFASIYFIPKPFHSSFFLASLAVLVAATWPRFMLLARTNLLFLALICVFALVTAASAFERTISIAVFGRNLASVAIVPLFCFAVAAAFERIGWHLLSALFICAVAATVYAFADYIWTGGAASVSAERFDAPGTGRNAIQFAGLMAAGIFVAGIDATDAKQTWYRRILDIICILLFVSLSFLSGSRGPLIALALTGVAAIVLFHRHRETPNGARLLLLIVCAWAVVTGVVFASLFFERVYCPFPAQFCRPAERLDIWGWVLDQVLAHPVLGTGADFRFPVLGKGHAHNGIWGLFMTFGVPAGLLWLWGIGSLILRADLSALGQKTCIFTCLALVYGAAYMGSDLPTPFSYIGVHYIFLWLPIALVIAAGKRTAHSDR